MLRKISVFIISLFMVHNSFASIGEKEYAKCAVITGDLSRLECFDNLAKSKKLNGKQLIPVSISDKGKWEVSVKINPIDDSKTVTLFLKADSGENKWGKPIYLIARCQSNTTDFYIAWNDYLGREANVLTRVGNNKAIIRQWSISSDQEATFHPKPVPFLKKMLKANKLISQITPYDANPVTAIFNTTGLINAIKPLRETCHW